MPTYPFLTAAWQDAANPILAEEQRPATPPVHAPRLEVRTDAGRTFSLVIVDDRPQFTRAPGEPTASAEVPEAVLRRALLDGNMNVLFAGVRSPTGNRETLLYFAYHLYPSGPSGAAAVAERVRAITAES